jgi:glycosyltransferase involved in cell wall biosynthesis
LLGIGWKAAALMKRAAPEKHLTFMTTGLSHMRVFLQEMGVEDFVSFNQILRHSTSESRPRWNGVSLEQEAARTADSIITHSDTIRLLYRILFESQMAKVCDEVIWFAEWIAQDALDHSDLRRPFGERDIDVLFIASNWMRPEKNYKLLKEIASRCKGMGIHIVGEVGEKTPHAVDHGLIAARSDLFSLMGRARAVVSPSLFDAAPGILFEASVMGCNIVASKNCGNWRLCNDTLLVDPFHVDGFVEKISIAICQKYEDNMDYFLGMNSYRKLMNRLLVV